MNFRKIEFANSYGINEEAQIFSSLSGKILTNILDTSGYYRVKLVCNDGISRKFLVHRLLAQVFIPNPENKPCVNHIDGDKTNNSLSNLEWVTVLENNLHAFKIGLNSNNGSNNPRTLLSEDLVELIYIDMLNGLRVNDVCKKYNITKDCAKGIRSKKNWKNVLDKHPDILTEKRSSRLSRSTIIWICEKIQEGLNNSEIISLSKNKNITISKLKDIRRRRCYSEISKDYVW